MNTFKNITYLTINWILGDAQIVPFLYPIAIQPLYNYA